MLVADYTIYGHKTTIIKNYFKSSIDACTKKGMMDNSMKNKRNILCN